MNKEESPYHKEYYGKAKNGKRFFVYSLIFIVLLGFLVFFFLGNPSFTGDAINSLQENNTLKIQSSLTVPSLSLNGDYKEITFSSRQGSLTVDNKKVSFEGSDNKVIIKDFNGNFGFKEGKITSLDGKASEIIINSVPISLVDGGEIKVVLNSEISYKSIGIKEGAYIKNLEYVSSGQMNVGENTIKINLEKVTLKNYLGSLIVSGETFTLDGIIEFVKVEGNSRRVVFEK